MGKKVNRPDRFYTTILIIGIFFIFSTFCFAQDDSNVNTKFAKAETEKNIAKKTVNKEARVELKSVDAKVKGDSVGITIKADGDILDYKTMTLLSPARIVYDFYNLSSQSRGTIKKNIDSKIVSRVRYYSYPDKLRVVLETTEKSLDMFSSSQIENGLIITVKKEINTLNEKDLSPEKATASIGSHVPEIIDDEKAFAASNDSLLMAEKKTVANSSSDATSSQVIKKESVEALPPVTANKAVKAPALFAQTDDAAEVTPAVAENLFDSKKDPVSGKKKWVNRIEFEVGERGRSTVIIGTTGPVKYEIKKIDDKQVQLELTNTSIPKYRQRPLITTRFQSAVDRVTPVVSGTKAVFIIEMRESVLYFTEEAGNLLKVHFDPSMVPPRPAQQAKLPEWKKVLEKSKIEDPATAAKNALTDVGGKYTGKKIALDFYETDIKNVFRILREISGKNFAVEKDVSGKVTLTLDKPVPWDQVLDLVLKMNKLGMIVEGDIIRIATQETLAAEEAAVNAKESAKLKAVAEVVDLMPMETAYLTVSYASATDIMAQISGILTEERGSVSVDTRNNQLIVIDVPDKLAQAREIVKRIDTVTPQVSIEARVVEATDNFSRNIGITWSTSGGIQGTDANAGTQSGDDFGPFGKELGGTTGYNTSMNMPLTSLAALGTLGLNFTRLAGSPFVLDASIVAAETKGDAKTISTPRIVTLDNKEAVIKQGLQYPYVTLDDSGNSTTSFKDIVLELKVTPHVTPDNRIALNIYLTNNEIGSVYNGYQSFTTKEATTELLVDDGDTVVIGGIRKSTSTEGQTGIPALSSIPIIGWLFKERYVTDSKEELLIFITPRIVRLEQKIQ